MSVGLSDETGTQVRSCDLPGCASEGLYRAPKSRERLNEYFWFCLDHVRAYNKAWDYYAGMSESQIEAHLRQDVTWQRPTWPMGYWRVQEQSVRDAVFRTFGLGGGAAGEDRFEGNPGAGNGQSRGRLRTPEEDALIILDLSPPVDLAQIKARYKQLVKIHHPDANGGDKIAEEKLKVINQAYNTLKACYAT